MQLKSTIDNHREISAALDFLRQASADDGAFDLDPRVVSGWVEMCLGALEVLVTAKRGKHADDKALGQKIYEHLSHATVHMEYAYGACKQDSTFGFNDRTGLDDDQLPHYDHATARIALLYARKAIVEQEAESDRVLAKKIKEGANGLMQTTEGIVGIATELRVRRAYPNSCKVEKVERGVEVSVPWSFATYYQYPGKLHSVYLSTPTRPIETDNKPGKTDAKCVAPITHWSVYVDGVNVTEATDVKCEYGSGIPGMDKMPGFWSETTFGTKKTGTWSVDIPLTFDGVTVPKRGIKDPYIRADIECGDIVGVAEVSVKKGDTVSVIPFSLNGGRFSGICDRVVAFGDFIYQCDIDPCHGCSYAKWPNKGPGYSARCDKCKLDPNRPGYVSK